MKICVLSIHSNFSHVIVEGRQNMFPFFYFPSFPLSKYYVRLLALLSYCIAVSLCFNCHHNIQQLLDWFLAIDSTSYVDFLDIFLFLIIIFLLFSVFHSHRCSIYGFVGSASNLVVGTNVYLLHFSAISQSIDVYNFQIYTRKYLTGIFRIVLWVLTAAAEWWWNTFAYIIRTRT